MPTTYSGVSSRHTSTFPGGRLRAAALALGVIVAGGCGHALADEIDYPSFHWTEPTYGAFLKELKADFEEQNPGLTIKDTFVPFGSYADQMYIDITSGNAPDILTALDPDFKRYVDADLLEALDKYLEEAGIKLDDFIAPEQLAMKDGKVYGIAFVTNPRALFVNTQMLKDAGFEMPANLEEFEKIVKALRDPTKQKFGLALSAYSGAPGQQYLEYAPIIASFGAKFFSDGKPSAETPEMVKALTFYKTVVEEGLVPKGAKFEVFRPMFVNGKIAMYAAGPFMGAVTQAGNPETYKHLATEPLPLGPGKPITVTNFLAIPKGAAHKDASAKLLMTILQDRWQQRIVELVKAIPGRKNVVSQEFIDENPWFKTFDTLAGESVSYAPEGAEQYGSDVVAIVGKRVEAMLFTGATPEDTAKSIQADLVAFMDSKK